MRLRRTCSKAGPTCARSRSSSATARSRPRSSTATSMEGGCDGSMTERTLDPEVEGFLALLATSRAPKTVEAYRRDLAALAAWLDRPVGRITTEQLEHYLAELRAAGLSPATIGRRALCAVSARARRNASCRSAARPSRRCVAIWPGAGRSSTHDTARSSFSTPKAAG